MNKTQKELPAVPAKRLCMLLALVLILAIASPVFAGIEPSPFKGEKAAQTGQNPQSPEDRLGIVIEERTLLIKADIASMKREANGVLNEIDKAGPGKNFQAISLQRSFAKLRKLANSLAKNAAADQKLSGRIKGLGKYLDRLEGANDRTAVRGALSEMLQALLILENDAKNLGR